MLQLDDSQHFNGLISGFAIPDQLDLRDIVYGSNTTVAFAEAPSNTSGTLTVTDGIHSANLTLLGQYVTGNFNFTSDGAGGTIVTDPPVPLAGRAIVANSQPLVLGQGGGSQLSALPIYRGQGDWPSA
jgi:hypothetical protein